MLAEGSIHHLQSLKIALCGLLCLLAVPSSAAEIRTLSLRAQNAEIGADKTECNFTLEGPIQAGDAERLASAVKQEYQAKTGVDYSQFAVLCLNSSGGSYAEAITIARMLRGDPDDTQPGYFYLGTMIREGDICISACSIIFMSGRYFAYEVGEYPWRYMNREAKLGFHSPSLIFPDAIYDKSTVEVAYATALQSVSAAVELLVLPNDYDGSRWMQPSLLAKLIATPPDEIFYVDEIDHVGRWGIGIFPSVDFDYEKLDVTNGCKNLLAWSRDESARSSDFGNYDGLVIERPSANHDRYPNEYRVIQDGMWIQGCKFDAYSLNGEYQVIGSIPFSDLGDQARTVQQGHHFLDARIKLRNIERMEAKDDMVDRKECKIFSALKEPLDDEICIYVGANTAELRAISRQEFTWPSGSKTIISRSDDGHQILNNARVVQENLLDGYTCLRNTKTDNTFCYR